MQKLSQDDIDKLLNPYPCSTEIVKEVVELTPEEIEESRKQNIEVLEKAQRESSRLQMMSYVKAKDLWVGN